MPVPKELDNRSTSPIPMIAAETTKVEAAVQKTVEQSAGSTTATRQPNLDSRLTKAHGAVMRGQYVEAIRALPADSRDPETKNAIAVCLMRLGQFEQAIPLLRSIALNSSLQRTSEKVPEHIRLNYATALFFGGQPAGGLEVVNEVNCPDHPGTWLIRDSAKEWVSRMSFLRKIDWMLNRIAPKERPTPIRTPVGQFVWDIA